MVGSLIFFNSTACGGPPLVIEAESSTKTIQQSEAKLEDDGREVFTIGFAPFTDPAKIKAMYANFAEYLSEKLQIKAKVVIVEDYDTLLENLKEGVIQAAFLSPVNYVKVMRAGTSGVVYCISAEIYGKADYYGVIIAHESSGLKSISAIRNRTFAFVDRNSASGFIFPYNTLLQNGINPERDFSRIFFLGTHTRILDALKAGRIAAGATYDGRLNDLPPEEKRQFTILARTEPVPYDAFVLSKTGAAKKEILRKLLQTLNRTTRLPDGRPVLDKETGVGITGFHIRDLSAYNKIEYMMRRARL